MRLADMGDSFFLSPPPLSVDWPSMFPTFFHFFLSEVNSSIIPVRSTSVGKRDGDFKGVEKFGVKIISPQKVLEEIKWEH